MINVRPQESRPFLTQFLPHVTFVVVCNSHLVRPAMCDWQLKRKKPPRTEHTRFNIAYLAAYKTYTTYQTYKTHTTLETEVNAVRH